MKKYTEQEMQVKFKDLLSKEGVLICTEDGQAFYNTPQGKSHALNHGASVKAKVMVIKAGTEEKKEPKKSKK